MNLIVGCIVFKWSMNFLREISWELNEENVINEPFSIMFVMTDMYIYFPSNLAINILA